MYSCKCVSLQSIITVSSPKRSPCYKNPIIKHHTWSTPICLPFFRIPTLRQARSSMTGAKASGIEGDTKLALISVSDKRDLNDLAKGLAGLGYTLVSTGGSAKIIESFGVSVIPVEQLTNFPEMLDGRVKTLHPNVHGAILAKRDNDSHLRSIKEHGIGHIEVVVTNLYPFRKTILSSKKVDYEEAIENIDIGGPAMIRAAAKNHKDVYVCVDSADYLSLLAHLGGSHCGKENVEYRKKLAWKAFQHCASYDSMVANWLWLQTGKGSPPELSVPLTKLSDLRYGENPHQASSIYLDCSVSAANKGGLAGAVQHHGKEMSYNNYLDGDAAYTTVCDFKEPTCVIVKHTNPCGISSNTNLLEAYENAVKADATSAFGGIVAFNRVVDASLAEKIRQFRSPNDGETRMFYELILAPGYTDEGLSILKGKSKTLRILTVNSIDNEGFNLRQISGGWLYQENDTKSPENIVFTVKSKKKPSDEQLEDCKFAWHCVKHIKSNAITIAKNQSLHGMGCGQPNRVKSVEIAIEKAGENVQGSTLASDAFFPFSWGDSVEKACKSGVAVIVHPGGSVRDQDAIDCCNQYGVALVTTSIRHFKH